MSSLAVNWIHHLDLVKHIEGGWYSEVYKSPVVLVDKQVHGERSLCTHIYFLLEQDDFSALHRIESDELWHFYAGDNLIVYEFDDSGNLTEHKLGKDPANGAYPFCCIRKGSWFGARVVANGEFCLVGCTVAPGFDFADLELAQADQLIDKYPAYKSIIASLCR